jgi:hypothetical protein
VTKKCDLLKKDQTCRKEEQVVADLKARGYQFQHSLKLAAKPQLLRQDIMEKEETTNGEYEVDMTQYFKLLPSDVDKKSLRKNGEKK